MFRRKKKRKLFGLKKCKKSLYSAGNCRLRFSDVHLCWALAILSRPAMSWNVTCFVEENKEDKGWFLAWKKKSSTYICSFIWRLWKITRMKQKKDYRRQAKLIFLAQHVKLRLHVYVTLGWPQLPFFAKFLVTGKINSYNDKQRLERNRFFSCSRQMNSLRKHPFLLALRR